MDNLVRLQKYISAAGVASRRKAEEMISLGRVSVNGETVREMGVKINPESDRVEIDGKAVAESSKKYYIMLNKPSGYITSTYDDRERMTVMELVKDIQERIYPVGRLDFDTEGLLILTNDGDFANKLIHPSRDIGKVYIAEVRGLVPLDKLKQLERGVDIGDCVTRPSEAELIRGTERESTVKITIKEGKKRQVRRMFDAIGYPVLKLKRVEIGPLMLGNLPRGKWRHLRQAEIDRIMR